MITLTKEQNIKENPGVIQRPLADITPQTHTEVFGWYPFARKEVSYTLGYPVGLPQLTLLCVAFQVEVPKLLQ